MIGSKSSTRCGRDEVHHSLPLLSPVDPDPTSPEEVNPLPMTENYGCFRDRRSATFLK
ncbi:hypothetical protein Ddye_016061 [Dipteronia dyeriana]|uniref:Uncharacterized protein n=1 Tax=Dipteronia dyeriana TaxID=168575 RepID=A0AAD9WZW6_9ROSI|nr:hypothetical protein Ddye_016061 [Dipteronia dyeriana]